MSERESLIFASLLHDIGKLAQRGEETLKGEYQKGEYLEQTYCPSYRFHPSHHHLLFSAQFIKEVFKDKAEIIETLVLSHHKPDAFPGDKSKRLSLIIQLADWLSSGERKKDEEETKEIQKEPLISIFSQIEIDKEKIGEKFCKPVKIERTLENFVPVKKEEAITGETNFKKLWEEFKKEAEQVSFSSSFRKIFNQFLFLLEKYTLFVPSAVYKAKSEISLFHHLKSTTAIATCIYDLEIKEKEIKEIVEKFGEEKFDELSKKKDFILLSGDISGIQDFIYSITSEHALKGLRGRSFYLQLLAEAIAYRILDEFSLTLCNLLYIGGGGFLILLPNRKYTKERIERLTEEIDRKIFDAHRGKLGIVISTIDLSYSNFRIGNFGEVIEKVGKRNAIEKRKKFKYILDEEFFKPQPERIEKELAGCKICGDEIEEGGKCPLCESFEKLAIEIKKAKFMGISHFSGSKKGKISSWDELIKNIGYEFKFKENKPDSEIIFSLNETDFLDSGCDGFRFEAIYSPEGTLEDIAKKADGVKRWGSLRMDVDNLGKIFREGFKRDGIDETTISRFSMLSYMLSMFFSLGIREIVESKYKDFCCVVYSGGDDLFIIGPWSKLPELAKEIYDNFRKYTASHPQITLSGGIYIAPGSKFPVYISAKEAGKAEEKAKREGKDKICFLDTEIKWKEEFEEINETKEKLYNLLKREDGKSKVSRSLLNILYSGYNEEKLIKKGDIPYPRIWRIFYGIKRFMERHKGYEKELEDIRKKFITDYKLQPKLNVAVRWAELLTRKEGDKNE
jgi:CRISPR-associated protein, Csm1 family